MSNASYILLSAASLDNGESTRIVCPRCNGGSNEEKTCSITRSESGSLVWQCFRASCTEKGGSGERNSESVVAPKKKVRKVFEGRTKMLSDELHIKLRNMWGILETPYWYWTPEMGGRVAMSVRSPKYTHRGWILRDISGRARCKALTYLDEREVGLSWYRNFDTGPTVLVEDIPSAVRASCYVNSVALLGTGIGTDRALEIAEFATRPVSIALDQDATALSFVYEQRFGHMWDNPQVLPLPKDLKNMTEDELKCTLEKINV